MQLAIDPVRDAAENVAYRFNAGIGVEEIKGAVTFQGAVWRLQPVGGFLLIADHLGGERDDAGEADGTVGLLRGESGVALKASTEGAPGDVEQFGYGFAVGKKGGRELRQNRG